MKLAEAARRETAQKEEARKVGVAWGKAGARREGIWKETSTTGWQEELEPPRGLSRTRGGWRWGETKGWW